MQNEQNTIWTIGHSTHTFQKFVTILQSFSIELLVDIRTFPGSRKFPHFNKEALSESLQTYHIQYIHLLSLGGRRKPLPDSKNSGWRSESFRGYADHMLTDTFNGGLIELEESGLRQRTAYMCSEAVWWRCHRSLLSDKLKLRGWKVMHITGEEKAKEHSYTQPAVISEGALHYPAIETK